MQRRALSEPATRHTWRGVESAIALAGAPETVQPVPGRTGTREPQRSGNSQLEHGYPDDDLREKAPGYQDHPARRRREAGADAAENRRRLRERADASTLQALPVRAAARGPRYGPRLPSKGSDERPFWQN